RASTTRNWSRTSSASSAARLRANAERPGETRNHGLKKGATTVSLDSRLSRLSPVLTAQERAVLVLEAWKDGKPEDPGWRSQMPREQAHAFNQLIDLMNAANRF